MFVHRIDLEELLFFRTCLDTWLDEIEIVRVGKPIVRRICSWLSLYIPMNEPDNHQLNTQI